jgi:uncharacterized protein (TIGR04255 family)
LLKESFPEYVRKIDQTLPIGLFNYQPVYQYWKNKSEWPVIQLGPGILTVNGTEKDYEWESFANQILMAVKSLIEAYEDNLSFNMIALRYIDSVSTNRYEFKDWQSFLNDNLNFNIQNNFENSKKLKQFHHQQVFEIDEGLLQVVVSNGKSSDDEDALVWQSAVYKTGQLQKDEIKDWISSAHTVNSNLFKNFTKEQFYASFTQSQVTGN